MRCVMVLCVVGLLMGCGATHTVLNKKELDLQTKMSATIFLDPTVVHRKTVILQVKNTSGQEELEIRPSLIAAIARKGYRVVENPKDADYILQANILQIGKIDLREAQQLASQGFGGALAGGALGSSAMAVRSSHVSDRAILGGALVGAIAGSVTDSLVKDVVYSLITDVQVSERAPRGKKFSQHTHSQLKQGAGGSVEIDSVGTTEWKQYQTRVVNTANKVNLKFEEALPGLVTKLSEALSGIIA